MRRYAWHHEGVPDPVTEVLQARADFDQARADAKALIDRARARLGWKIRRARDAGTSQTAILKEMDLSREQVRAYEKAYRDWLKENDPFEN